MNYSALKELIEIIGTPTTTATAIPDSPLDLPLVSTKSKYPDELKSKLDKKIQQEAKARVGLEGRFRAHKFVKLCEDSPISKFAAEALLSVENPSVRELLALYESQYPGDMGDIVVKSLHRNGKNSDKHVFGENDQALMEDPEFSEKIQVLKSLANKSVRIL